MKEGLKGEGGEEIKRAGWEGGRNERERENERLQWGMGGCRVRAKKD